MFRWFKDLDKILRGDATRLQSLQRGNIEVSARGLLVVILFLGVIYGVCMGCYALFKEEGPEVVQVLATAVKVPLLFLLTLGVTFPSLYVFNALVGSRLQPVTALRLLMSAIAVMMAVLASMGPIVAFFSLSTTSYNFMKLLNVTLFAVAGFLGLGFLLQTLHRLTVAQEVEAEPMILDPAETPTTPTATSTETAPTPPPVDELGALQRMEGRVIPGNVRTIFRIWVVVFGLVGAQMAWILRPFIGHPGMKFELFRGREDNFFVSVLIAIKELMGGSSGGW